MQRRPPAEDMNSPQAFLFPGEVHWFGHVGSLQVSTALKK
jgi:hypothetical protein